MFFALSIFVYLSGSLIWLAQCSLLYLSLFICLDHWSDWRSVLCSIYLCLSVGSLIWLAQCSLLYLSLFICLDHWSDWRSVLCSIYLSICLDHWSDWHGVLCTIYLFYLLDHWSDWRSVLCSIYRCLSVWIIGQTGAVFFALSIFVYLSGSLIWLAQCSLLYLSLFICLDHWSDWRSVLCSIYLCLSVGSLIWLAQCSLLYLSLFICLDHWSDWRSVLCSIYLCLSVWIIGQTGAVFFALSIFVCLLDHWSDWRSVLCSIYLCLHVWIIDQTGTVFFALSIFVYLSGSLIRLAQCSLLYLSLFICWIIDQIGAVFFALYIFVYLSGSLIWLALCSLLYLSLFICLDHWSDCRSVLCSIYLCLPVWIIDQTGAVFFALSIFVYLLDHWSDWRSVLCSIYRCLSVWIIGQTGAVFFALSIFVYMSGSLIRIAQCSLLNLSLFICWIIDQTGTVFFALSILVSVWIIDQTGTVFFALSIFVYLSGSLIWLAQCSLFYLSLFICLDHWSDWRSVLCSIYLCLHVWIIDQNGAVFFALFFVVYLSGSLVRLAQWSLLYLSLFICLDHWSDWRSVLCSIYLCLHVWIIDLTGAVFFVLSIVVYLSGSLVRLAQCCLLYLSLFTCLDHWSEWRSVLCSIYRCLSVWIIGQTGAVFFALSIFVYMSGSLIRMTQCSLLHLSLFICLDHWSDWRSDLCSIYLCLPVWIIDQTGAVFFALSIFVYLLDHWSDWRSVLCSIYRCLSVWIFGQTGAVFFALSIFVCMSGSLIRMAQCSLLNLSLFICWIIDQTGTVFFALSILVSVWIIDQTGTVFFALSILVSVWIIDQTGTVFFALSIVVYLSGSLIRLAQCSLLYLSLFICLDHWSDWRSVLCSIYRCLSVWIIGQTGAVFFALSIFVYMSGSLIRMAQCSLLYLSLFICLDHWSDWCSDLCSIYLCLSVWIIDQTGAVFFALSIFVYLSGSLIWLAQCSLLYLSLFICLDHWSDWHGVLCSIYCCLSVWIIDQTGAVFFALSIFVYLSGSLIRLARCSLLYLSLFTCWIIDLTGAVFFALSLFICLDHWSDRHSVLCSIYLCLSVWIIDQTGTVFFALSIFVYLLDHWSDWRSVLCSIYRCLSVWIIGQTGAVFFALSIFVYLSGSLVRLAQCLLYLSLFICLDHWSDWHGVLCSIYLCLSVWIIDQTGTVFFALSIFVYLLDHWSDWHGVLCSIYLCLPVGSLIWLAQCSLFYLSLFICLDHWSDWHSVLCSIYRCLSVWIIGQTGAVFFALSIFVYLSGSLIRLARCSLLYLSLFTCLDHWSDWCSVLCSIYLCLSVGSLIWLAQCSLLYLSLFICLDHWSDWHGVLCSIYLCLSVGSLIWLAQCSLFYLSLFICLDHWSDWRSVLCSIYLCLSVWIIGQTGAVFALSIVVYLSGSLIRLARCSLLYLSLFICLDHWSDWHGVLCSIYLCLPVGSLIRLARCSLLYLSLFTCWIIDLTGAVFFVLSIVVYLSGSLVRLAQCSLLYLSLFICLDHWSDWRSVLCSIYLCLSVWIIDQTGTVFFALSIFVYLSGSLIRLVQCSLLYLSLFICWIIDLTGTVFFALSIFVYLSGSLIRLARCSLLYLSLFICLDHWSDWRSVLCSIYLCLSVWIIDQTGTVFFALSIVVYLSGSLIRLAQCSLLYLSLFICLDHWSDWHGVLCSIYLCLPVGSLIWLAQCSLLYLCLSVWIIDQTGTVFFALSIFVYLSGSLIRLAQCSLLYLSLFICWIIDQIGAVFFALSIFVYLSGSLIWLAQCSLLYLSLFICLDHWSDCRSVLCSIYLCLPVWIIDQTGAVFFALSIFVYLLDHWSDWRSVLCSIYLCLPVGSLIRLARCSLLYLSLFTCWIIDLTGAVFFVLSIVVYLSGSLVRLAQCLLYLSLFICLDHWSDWHGVLCSIYLCLSVWIIDQTGTVFFALSIFVYLLDHWSDWHGVLCSIYLCLPVGSLIWLAQCSLFYLSLFICLDHWSDWHSVLCSIYRCLSVWIIGQTGAVFFALSIFVYLSGSLIRLARCSLLYLSLFTCLDHWSDWCSVLCSIYLCLSVGSLIWLAQCSLLYLSLFICLDHWSDWHGVLCSIYLCLSVGSLIWLAQCSLFYLSLFICLDHWSDWRSVLCSIYLCLSVWIIGQTGAVFALSIVVYLSGSLIRLARCSLLYLSLLICLDHWSDWHGVLCSIYLCLPVGSLIRLARCSLLYLSLFTCWIIDLTGAVFFVLSIVVYLSGSLVRLAQCSLLYLSLFICLDHWSDWRSVLCSIYLCLSVWIIDQTGTVFFALSIFVYLSGSLIRLVQCSLLYLSLFICWIIDLTGTVFFALSIFVYLSGSLIRLARCSLLYLSLFICLDHWSDWRSVLCSIYLCLSVWIIDQTGTVFFALSIVVYLSGSLIRLAQCSLLYLSLFICLDHWSDWHGVLCSIYLCLPVGSLIWLAQCSLLYLCLSVWIIDQTGTVFFALSIFVYLSGSLIRLAQCSLLYLSLFICWIIDQIGAVFFALSIFVYLSGSLIWLAQCSLLYLSLFICLDHWSDCRSVLCSIYLCLPVWIIDQTGAVFFALSIFVYLLDHWSDWRSVLCSIYLCLPVGSLIRLARCSLLYLSLFTCWIIDLTGAVFFVLSIVVYLSGSLVRLAQCSLLYLSLFICLDHWSDWRSVLCSIYLCLSVWIIDQTGTVFFALSIFVYLSGSLIRLARCSLLYLSLFICLDHWSDWHGVLCSIYLCLPVGSLIWLAQCSLFYLSLFICLDHWSDWCSVLCSIYLCLHVWIIDQNGAVFFALSIVVYLLGHWSDWHGVLCSIYLSICLDHWSDWHSVLCSICLCLSVWIIGQTGAVFFALSVFVYLSGSLVRLAQCSLLYISLFTCLDHWSEWRSVLCSIYRCLSVWIIGQTVAVFFALSIFVYLSGSLIRLAQCSLLYLSLFICLDHWSDWRSVLCSIYLCLSVWIIDLTGAVFFALSIVVYLSGSLVRLSQCSLLYLSLFTCLDHWSDWRSVLCSIYLCLSVGSLIWLAQCSLLYLSLFTCWIIDQTGTVFFALSIFVYLLDHWSDWRSVLCSIYRCLSVWIIGQTGTVFFALSIVVYLSGSLVRLAQCSLLYLSLFICLDHWSDCRSVLCSIYLCLPVWIIDQTGAVFFALSIFVYLLDHWSDWRSVLCSIYLCLSVGSLIWLAQCSLLYLSLFICLDHWSDWRSVLCSIYLCLHVWIIDQNSAVFFAQSIVVYLLDHWSDWHGVLCSIYLSICLDHWSDWHGVLCSFYLCLSVWIIDLTGAVFFVLSIVVYLSGSLVRLAQCSLLYLSLFTCLDHWSEWRSVLCSIFRCLSVWIIGQTGAVIFALSIFVYLSGSLIRLAQCSLLYLSLFTCLDHWSDWRSVLCSIYRCLSVWIIGQTGAVLFALSIFVYMSGSLIRMAQCPLFYLSLFICLDHWSDWRSVLCSIYLCLHVWIIDQNDAVFFAPSIVVYLSGSLVRLAQWSLLYLSLFTCLDHWSDWCSVLCSIYLCLSVGSLIWLAQCSLLYLSLFICLDLWSDWRSVLCSIYLCLHVWLIDQNGAVFFAQSIVVYLLDHWSDWHGVLCSIYLGICLDHWSDWHGVLCSIYLCLSVWIIGQTGAVFFALSIVVYLSGSLIRLARCSLLYLSLLICLDHWSDWHGVFALSIFVYLLDHWSDWHGVLCSIYLCLSVGSLIWLAQCSLFYLSLFICLDHWSDWHSVLCSIYRCLSVWIIGQTGAVFFALSIFVYLSGSLIRLARCSLLYLSLFTCLDHWSDWCSVLCSIYLCLSVGSLIWLSVLCSIYLCLSVWIIDQTGTVFFALSIFVYLSGSLIWLAQCSLLYLSLFICLDHWSDWHGVLCSIYCCLSVWIIDQTGAVFFALSIFVYLSGSLIRLARCSLLYLSLFTCWIIDLTGAVFFALSLFICLDHWSDRHSVLCSIYLCLPVWIIDQTGAVFFALSIFVYLLDHWSDWRSVLCSIYLCLSVWIIDLTGAVFFALSIVVYLSGSLVRLAQCPLLYLSLFTCLDHWSDWRSVLCSIYLCLSVGSLIWLAQCSLLYLSLFTCWIIDQTGTVFFALSIFVYLLDHWSDWRSVLCSIYRCLSVWIIGQTGTVFFALSIVVYLSGSLVRLAQCSLLYLSLFICLDHWSDWHCVLCSIYLCLSVWIIDQTGTVFFALSIFVYLSGSLIRLARCSLLYLSLFTCWIIDLTGAVFFVLSIVVYLSGSLVRLVQCSLLYLSLFTCLDHWSEWRSVLCSIYRCLSVGSLIRLARCSLLYLS